MPMKPDELKAAIERVRELDKKRTPGDWYSLRNRVYDGIHDICEAGWNNSPFLASAPLMMKIIEAQEAENERLRAMLDIKLPCDIRLPPATTVKAGCKLSTLIRAFEIRLSDAAARNAGKEG